MSDPKLTQDAKEAIRKYMLKLVVLPGVASIVVAFLLGFFIRDVALSKAQNDAFREATKEVVDLVKKTEKARLDLKSVTDKSAALDESIESRRVASDKSLERIRTEQAKLARRVASIRELLDDADTELKKLIANPKDTIAALKLLSQFTPEMEVATLIENRKLRIDDITFAVQCSTAGDVYDLQLKQSGDELLVKREFGKKIVNTWIIPVSDTYRYTHQAEFNVLQASIINDNQVKIRCSGSPVTASENKGATFRLFVAYTQ